MEVQEQKPDRVQVKGMTCSNCAMSVERTLQKLGLENIQVDHTTGEVRFQNAERIDEEKIREAVQGLGYDVAESDRSSSLQVEGMTCTNCADSVQRGLQNVGLQAVEVDHVTGQVRFQNPNGISREKTRKAVEGLGYHVSDEKEEEEKGWSLIEKKFFFALSFTLPLFLHMFLPASSFLNNALVQIGLALPVFILGVLHFGKSAWNGIKSGVTNMDVLIFIGSTAAFGYSLSGVIMHYPTSAVQDFLFFETSATIITLVLLGNLIEQRSVARTSSAIRELDQLKRSEAKRILEQANGTEYETIEAEEVQIGDLLQIDMGARVPVDGRVIEGEASADESMITGESEPVHKKAGDRLIGGTVLQEGSLKMEADKVGDETVLSNIIEMVKRAQHDKPSIQRMGDKVSSVFVPVVLLISLSTFLISYFAVGLAGSQALMNSIAVLVISCPCAMGLATPTAVAAGIGRAAKNGVLIKGGSTLEEYSGIKNVVLDKTGTLTNGKFSITGIESLNGLPEDQIRAIVLALEERSSHPIAKALVKELKGKSGQVGLQDVEEVKGEGIQGRSTDGDIYKLGSARFTGTEEGGSNSTLFLKKNEELVSRIAIQDGLKSGAKEMIDHLRGQGVRTILLSGDKKENCDKIASELGIDVVHAEQLPDEKLKRIEAYANEAPTSMVGDGVNDAPALARSNVGVSLGDATEVAIQSARVVLLDGSDLRNVNYSMALSRNTVSTIKQNLFWAFFYNVIAIPIAAVGLLNPMIAALSMAFSDVIVVGNSIRLKFKRIE